MKLKFILSYDGSAFLGSATQPHQNSVQDTLARALKHLGINERPLFASRTDKGVHSLGNVASVSCGEHFKDLLYMQRKLNKHLEPFMMIKKIQVVSDEFQVRFDAKKRVYLYMLNHNKFNPLLSRFFHFYPQIDKNEAATLLKLFEGEHDFCFFCKGEVRGTKRKIFSARIYQKNQLSILRFCANGFLRSQIRLIISALLKTLEGKLSKNELVEQIEGKKRHWDTLAPPNGLYLSKVIY